MAFKSILIVDDDEYIRLILQEIFNGEGYPVLLAVHGRAALDLLEMSSIPKPGLIFLDLMMPVMDGPTFLSVVKRSHPQILDQIPVFAMTAGGAGTPLLTIQTTGFLKKPLDLDELSKIAARYCV